MKVLGAWPNRDEFLPFLLLGMPTVSKLVGSVGLV